MGNNIIHINAGKYINNNIKNLVSLRQDVFLYFMSQEIEENKKLNKEEDSLKNDNKANLLSKPKKEDLKLLEKYSPEEQMEYISKYKLTPKLKNYIKSTLFLNFNIPEIQKYVNEKLKSKTLFEATPKNMNSLNIFGIKIMNIVRKYIDSIIPQELKFIIDEPLFYYYVNQLHKPLEPNEIIFTIYDFVTFSDLGDEKISKILNVKNDNVLKEQIALAKKIKEEHFADVNKYYEIENNKTKISEKFANNYQLFIIFCSVLIMLVAIYLYYLIKK